MQKIKAMENEDVLAMARFKVTLEGESCYHDLYLLPPFEESHYGNGTYTVHYSDWGGKWHEVRLMDTRYVGGITKDFKKFATDEITAWADSRCKIELVEAEG